MSPRAMWKASLALGDELVPIKLYAAAEDRDVHFRLLHAQDLAPVLQWMVDPRSEQRLAPEEVVRGIEVEKGVFVRLRDDELARVAPEPSRTIELLRFVPAPALDAAWYERPYFLGPDGADGRYAGLCEALRTSGQRGVARWAMRGRRYFGALEARDRHLVLIALRSAQEVVSAEALPRPEGAPASAAERRLAEQLVAALEGPFEPATLRDEYRERLLAHLAARSKGRRIKPAAEKAPKPSPDLEAALARSVRAVKKRRAA
jgi:DNA end-binding protein Ku